MKEQLDIEFNFKGEKDLESILEDIQNGLNPIDYLENKILKSTSQQLGKLKQIRTVFNDIAAASGSTMRAQLKNFGDEDEIVMGLTLEDISLTKAKEKIKESLGVDIDITKFGDINSLIEQLSDDLGFTLKTEEGILSVKEDQLKIIQKQINLINKLFKASGVEERAELNMVKDEDNEQTQVGIKLQSKKINQDKREVRGLEHLLRRYRWAQSLFLVTQNFMGRMGESISVFGAGMNMLFAPLKMFFNVLLLPALPIIAAFSKALMGGVKWFADWFLGASGLATAISSLAWAMAMFIQTLPIAGLIVGIGEGLKTLIYGFLGIEDAAKVAGKEGESFAFKLGEALGKSIRWMIDEGPNILKVFWDKLKTAITWVIDNAPNIKTKIIEIWNYIDQTVIPGVTSFIDDIIKKDLVGTIERIVNKAKPLITQLGDFFTTHGPLIDRILEGGAFGTIVKAGGGILSGARGVAGFFGDALAGGKGAIGKLFNPLLAADVWTQLLQSPAYVGVLQGSGLQVGQGKMYKDWTPRSERGGDTFNITLNSSATNSDEMFNEIMLRIQREGVARGTVM